MKFASKVEGKLNRLRRFARVEIFRRHARDAPKPDPTGAAQAKEQVIRSVCQDYLAQLEPQLNYEKFPKILSRATRENFMYDGSFHEAVGSVLLMAELFAVMPVRGVTGPHPQDMNFSWSHWRTWYSAAFIVGSVADLVISMYKVLHTVITFNTIEPLIFRGSILAVSISAFHLARQWPALMVQWDETQRDLPPYLTQMEKRRLAYKIRTVAFVGMSLALGEHLLSIIADIKFTQMCPRTESPIKNFFLLAYKELFFVFPYSHWLSWLLKFMNVLSTFIWSFMDVFVMIISIGLTSLFTQLNDNLQKFKGMQMPEAFWSERRIQYRNLCVLCENMDNAISVITMVSYSNNLYFISVQLLKSLNKMPSTAHIAYFYYSLFFLIGRTLAVSLYTADINDESKKPQRVLRCVPKESWGPEVKRFSEEINSDFVALSGMKFFHLTRKLVLSVAGTIVTYELVLIQFHEDNNNSVCNQD